MNKRCEWCGQMNGQEISLEVGRVHPERINACTLDHALDYFHDQLAVAA